MRFTLEATIKKLSSSIGFANERGVADLNFYTREVMAAGHWMLDAGGH